MKKKYFLKSMMFVLLAGHLYACNGGKHEAETNLKDSTPPNTSSESGRPYIDKTDTIYNTDSMRGRDSSGNK